MIRLQSIGGVLDNGLACATVQVMGRLLRINEAGMFYHVLNRGNEKRIIFRDDHDCEAFRRHLGKCSQRFGRSLYAYVLMDNHYHLLVKTDPSAQPPIAMQWLQLAYGTW